jgi:hypothetical protein
MPLREGSLDRSAIQSLIGLKTTDKIGFYGVTPVSQRAAAIQAVSFISVSSNATVGSAVAAFNAEVAATLVALGFWKGAA